MVALVGASGAGKSLLDELADSVVHFTGCDMPVQETPRSGEAIPASIGAARIELDESGISRTVIDYRHPARAYRLFWDEVGKLTAQSRRTGSTMTEYLKEAVSGSMLGGQTAAGNGLTIPSGSYRVTVTLSVQPRRAEGLLGSAETEGGLAGRITWFSLQYEPWINMPRPAAPLINDPLIVETRHWATHGGFIQALPEMEEAHEADRRLSHAGERDDSDSHLVLARAITAIALMNLNGRDTLDPQDWFIAGLVMEHSRRVLEAVKEELAAPDPTAGAELLRKEVAVMEKMYERRDAGMPYREAFSRLGRTAREVASELLADGRLERW